jgi:hypothetical protein
MILRAMGLGFVLWLANAAIFRFAGHMFFQPGIAPPFVLFGIVILMGAALTFVGVRVLGAARGDEGEAAVSLAFPSLFLNAVLTHEFAMIFPNLDAGLDGVYGGLAMIYAASMVFTGLVMTRLAPQDERV